MTSEMVTISSGEYKGILNSVWKELLKENSKALLRWSDYIRFERNRQIYGALKMFIGFILTQNYFFSLLSPVD